MIKLERSKEIGLFATTNSCITYCKTGNFHVRLKIAAHATPLLPKGYNTDLIPLNMEAKVALQAKVSHN